MSIEMPKDYADGEEAMHSTDDDVIVQLPLCPARAPPSVPDVTTELLVLQECNLSDAVPLYLVH